MGLLSWLLNPFRTSENDERKSRCKQTSGEFDDDVGVAPTVRWRALKRIPEIETREIPVERIDGVGTKLQSTLSDAGYETVADIRTASVDELQNVDGIGDQRAEQLHSWPCTRGPEDIRGVGKARGQQLREAGFTTAVEITAAELAELTQVDGVGDVGATELQARAAAFVDIDSSPPPEVFENHDPTDVSGQAAVERVDKLETLLHRYDDVSPILEGSVEPPEDIVSMYEPPYESPEQAAEYLDILATLVEYYHGSQEVPCGQELVIDDDVRDKLEIRPLPVPSVLSEEVYSDPESLRDALDTPRERREHRMSYRENLESVANKLDAIDTDTRSQLVEQIQSVHQHVRTAAGEDESDFYRTCGQYLNALSVTVEAQNIWPEYPFKSILTELIECDVTAAEESVQERISDLRHIVVTARDALLFLDDLRHDHPAVDDARWRDDIRTALEESYPDVLNPIASDLDRFDGTVWEESDLFQYDWQEFESLVAALYEAEGYATKVTQGHRDMGVDVWAETEDEKLAIQVKAFEHGNTVGRKTLQQLSSTLAKGDADTAVVVTSSAFAQTAERYADDFGSDLRLIDGDDLVSRLSRVEIPPP